MEKDFLILPLLFYSKNNDGTKSITFGWFTKTWSLKY